MKKIIILVLGYTLLTTSTFSFADDNYRYNNNINNNDWSDTPWGQNNSSGDRNSMPWGGNSMPWGSDNPFWDRGSDAWRDWDTNKWGGNGMPWGGGGMPWSNDRKYNRNYGPSPYARPYNGGYGNPYQGGGYRANPYNAGPAYTPPPPAQ